LEPILLFPSTFRLFRSVPDTLCILKTGGETLAGIVNPAIVGLAQSGADALDPLAASAGIAS
jgi:hypothetical protein